MPSVKFAPGTLHNLERLHDFLRSKNPAASKKAAKILVQSVRILEQHPQIGRPRDDMKPEYRELVIGFGYHGYVVLYRLDGDSVIVMAIRHQLEAGYEANNG